MTSTTKIEWTDQVWNPVTGCDKVSPGCAHCYAERMAKRLRGRFGYPADNPFKVTLHPDRLTEPLKHSIPTMYFVCSMGDLFHKDVPDDFINRVFAIMALCPQHIFQVLTKRPERMAFHTKHIDILKLEQAIHHLADTELNNLTKYPPVIGCPSIKHVRFPLHNVWLGTSVENQKAAKERIPHLIKCSATVRFLSCEPLLESVVQELDVYSLDWVIVGGESGPGARPMDPDWVRSIRDLCQWYDVPFFFKQWGGVHKNKAGRLLDGIEHNAMPNIDKAVTIAE